MADSKPSPERFRDALASYPTGVTVVTAMGADGPAGATANAVTSLSLEPPMMLACLDRGSRTLESHGGRIEISLSQSQYSPIGPTRWFTWGEPCELR